MKKITTLLTLAFGFLLLGVGSITAQDVVSDKEARKAERQAVIAQYKADVEAIKNDTSLTDEQRKEKLREVRQEASLMKGKKKRKNKAAQNERGRELTAEKRAAKEAYRQRILEIDNDSRLTDEQKVEAKKAIREEQRAEWNAARGAKVGSTGKGKGGRKALKRKKVEKLEKKIESGLSAEEKTKVISRLDKVESKLDKQYSKGKIKEENYTKRKAEIADLRSRI